MAFTQHYTFTKHAVERLYERTGGSEEAKAVLFTVKKHLQSHIMQMIWESIVRGDKHAQRKTFEDGWTISYRWDSLTTKLRIVTIYQFKRSRLDSYA